MKTGIMVEEMQMECDEMTQKSLALLLTLPGWYQTWINTATETMLEKSKKLRTALAEKEAKAKTLKKLAREDGDYYHQLQVRLSNLEEEKRIWDLGGKGERRIRLPGCLNSSLLHLRLRLQWDRIKVARQRYLTSAKTYF